MSVTVRRACASDAAALAALENSCFSKPWSELALAEGLARDDARYFAADVDGNDVGYLGAHNVFGDVSVTNIAVDPAFRRRGVASALLSALLTCAGEEGASRVLLEVRVSNDAAVRLYEKAGFHRLCVRSRFYEAPVEDGAVYEYVIGEVL